MQNVELNEFFERRGTQASWAMLVGYYLLLPFAIGGLVVMRRRRIPIYPFIAIVVADHHHRGDRLPRHPLPGLVRRGHARARGGRARRALGTAGGRARPRPGTRPRRARRLR